MTTKKDYPLSVFVHFLKKNGALRVSPDAAKLFREEMENKTKDIGLQALKYMRHAKRKTLQKSDIEFAITKD